MSGICGIVNADGAPVDRPLLQEMTMFMAFRGPDAQDIWIDGPVGFGHALLRTTAESEHEHQPLSLDGKVWITADARIDGQTELRKQLEEQGRTNLAAADDIELILHAYHAWGEDCVGHLIGDFAFAIWDGPRQRLFCARDHFGVKPFFYASLGPGLIFSNTLDCLRRHPAVSATLDDLWIADFLLFEMSQDPATTAFEDIRRLPPGHCLAWSSSGVQVRRYWELPAAMPVQYRPAGDYVEHFRTLFESAISDRLRSNRVGIDMSGGLDSTSIAAVASLLLSKQPAPIELHAYTVVYDTFFPDQERHYATMMANKLGIPIHYCVADSFGLYERGDQSGTLPPEPYHDPHSAIGIKSIQDAAAHGRVVLTGWDGDALMSESPIPYFRSLLKERKFGQSLMGILGYVLSQWRAVPRHLLKRLIHPLGKKPEGIPPLPEWLNPDLERSLDLQSRWKQFHSVASNKHPVRPKTIHSLSVLIDLSSFFEYYDAGVTHRPVEYRHPLLDQRLVEYCLSLPPWPWCVKKQILRIAMRGLLPEQVRLRPKAALAGYPYLALLPREQSRWIDQFVAFPALNRYVYMEKMPIICEDDDPNSSWTNLRPITLGLWLKGLQPTITDP
jgi:asparagine synthase (glutamine-hydrolysing)